MSNRGRQFSRPSTPNSELPYAVPSQGPKEHYRYKHLPEVTSDSWGEVMNAMTTYDKELCEGWNKEIDSTLVFAGLFSATLTAFTIESYKWLNEDSATATVRLLAQLSQHLGTTNVTDSPSFVVTPDVIRINSFWFLSLIVTLSAALIGILCKQWIREYRRGSTTSSTTAFELRQLRHQSWEAWHVPDIISSTSVLLQLALLLFFAGVIDLLWSRVRATIVASVITVAVGLSFFFSFCSRHYFRLVYGSTDSFLAQNALTTSLRNSLII